jgi:hypothetical protein
MLRAMELILAILGAGRSGSSFPPDGALLLAERRRGRLDPARTA